MIQRNQYIILLAVLGLALRLLFSPLWGFEYDMGAWFAWAIRLQSFDFAHFYTPDVWTNYTPGFLYPLSLIGFLKNVFGFSDNLTFLLIKLPTIISEIIISIFIYQVFRTASFRKKLILAGLILFNLALIFNSAIWGQIDGLVTLFMILTVYYFDKQRFILAGVLFGLTILIKPQALALAPVFLIYFLQNFNWKNITNFSLISILTLLMTSFPFFISNPFFGIFGLVKQMTADYPYNSLNAYNFWGLFGFWLPDNQTFYGLSFQIWGFILFFLYWVIILYFYRRQKYGLYTLASLATLSFFFLPTRAHERYLYPAIPFLVLSLKENYSKLKIYLIIALSLIYLLNLHYVYVYYNQIANKVPEIIRFNSIYQFEDIHKQLLSFTSTLIFVVLSYLLIFNKRNTDA